MHEPSEAAVMTVSGYKDHTRTPGFNAGTLTNDWEAKKLTHDRDIEIWIDPDGYGRPTLPSLWQHPEHFWRLEQAILKRTATDFPSCILN